ncbi:acyl-CoA dehydrogenase [Helicobacter sp. MIT 05-5293]|uniref:acyl-CoA dehydrogenase family protein n=1 Tax=Helicobacter sp. MIT 05-5293 TaxID=1548149 RepID=UPI00068D2D99|nr:acyl-CoA dehydrogenase family protein [Helicobacter sp. MIT 05-5293]TLD80975.1 acyl-CoA dehydrogenase [Helicobacter sp. MIT 05-5293]
MDSLTPILERLHKDVVAIHKGFYPRSILVELGKAGAYQSFLTQGEKGLMEAIEVIAQVSCVCGNTGFCVWAQEALAWYLYNSANPDSELFAKVSQGAILGGTGLSNPVKSFAGLESIKLKASKVSGGYLINGTLPWVSNIEQGHYFGAIAKVESDEPTESPHYVMGIVECNGTSVALKEEIKFCGLEGSATKSVILKDYFLSAKRIISDPLEAKLPQIMPGFVLLQIGIALGLIQSGIDKITKESHSKNGVNAYLPMNLENLISQKDSLLKRTQTLAQTPFDTRKEYFHDVLQLKSDCASLTLLVAQNCMLATGTKGYLQNSLASKLLIESYFVAIVTPSIKHIAKVLES